MHSYRKKLLKIFHPVKFFHIFA